MKLINLWYQIWGGGETCNYYFICKSVQRPEVWGPVCVAEPSSEREQSRKQLRDLLKIDEWTQGDTKHSHHNTPYKCDKKGKKEKKKREKGKEEKREREKREKRKAKKLKHETHLVW